jgi:dynactin 1
MGRQPQAKPITSPEPAEKQSPPTPQTRPAAGRLSMSTARTPLVIPRTTATPVRLDSPKEESPVQPVPSPQVPSPSIPRPRVSSTVSQVHSEDQELRAKIRYLEARRADDVQRIRELETRLNDAEGFVSLRPKLQAKLNQLQQESLQAKRELQDQLTELQAAEVKLSESAEQLEVVMLDKEMAEERAEASELEMEDLKEKLAVAQVELSVLKEHGAAAAGGGKTGDGADGKFTLAYIQLERQNERLKEALLR